MPVPILGLSMISLTCVSVFLCQYHTDKGNECAKYVLRQSKTTQQRYIQAGSSQNETEMAKWAHGKKTAPNQSSPEKCKLGRLQAVTLLHAAWLLWKQKQKQKQSQWRGGCGKKGSPVHCGEDSKLAQTFSKTAWGFLEELKIEPPYDPAILLLGI